MASGTAAMTKERKAPKTAPVRLTEDAVRWARIASGYTGESMSEYVSRIVAEIGQRDADRLHDEAKSEARPTAGPEPRRKPKP